MSLFYVGLISLLMMKGLTVPTYDFINSVSHAFCDFQFVSSSFWKLICKNFFKEPGWSQRILQKESALFSKGGHPRWFECRLPSCMRISLRLCILRDFPSTLLRAKSQNRQFSCSPQGLENCQLTFTLFVNTFGSPLLGYWVVWNLGFVARPTPWGHGNWRSNLTNALRAWIKLSSGNLSGIPLSLCFCALGTITFFLAQRNILTVFSRRVGLESLPSYPWLPIHGQQGWLWGDLQEVIKFSTKKMTEAQNQVAVVDGGQILDVT